MDCVACGSAGVTERTGLPPVPLPGMQQGFQRTLRYPSDNIALVVLWRLRYRLTLRDLAEMFLVRGIIFSHEAITW
jgi:putative transposase